MYNAVKLPQNELIFDLRLKEGKNSLFVYNISFLDLIIFFNSGFNLNALS